ncbi:MAG TPA: hypothetical protein VFZ48_05285 [Candidatus Saccharimonadales bacterium]
MGRRHGGRGSCDINCLGCRRCNFGSGDPVYDSRTSTAPVHATTTDGQEVTVSFGKGSNENELFIADGHVEDPKEFWGEHGVKGHDHFFGNGEGTNRDKFTG